MNIAIKLLVVSVFFTGCLSQETIERNKRELAERKQAVADYRSKGWTCYVGYRSSYKCFNPTEQERLVNFELACLQGGGIPQFEGSLKYYTGCARPRTASTGGTIKPYCPPSKYPIYGCGGSSSTSNTSPKPPPGNKTCMYKSGTYVWSKTISGLTCPPTDSSNGYFGTLVR